MRWQLCLPQHLHLRTWGEQAVLYHSLSGDTHLIEASAAAIIEQLRLAPASDAELASLFTSEPDPALAAQLAILLSNLTKLGVVEAH